MTTDVRSPIPLHIQTVLATTFSTLALVLVFPWETAAHWGPVLVWAGITSCVAGAAHWMHRLARSWQTPPALSPIFLAMIILPPIVLAIGRWLELVTVSWEVGVIMIAQLLGSALAAAGAWRGYQPLAMICCLFVTVFATSMSVHPGALLAATGYAFAAVWWLSSTYWERFRSDRQQARPWIPGRTSLILAFTVSAAMIATAFLIPADRVWALTGFAPSSGGTKDYDPMARRGIGDGDALVAGQEDIQSFGPIEDAPFRNSDDPSLYDLYSELYDEPVVSNRTDRAIPLPPETIQQLNCRMAKSQKASRDFTVLRRQQRDRGHSMSSIASDAMFYVKGRVPLHLRHEIYDIFDGVNWHPVDVDELQALPKLSFVEVRNKPWLLLSPSRVVDIFAGYDAHAIKIVHLRGPVIPSPLHLRGIHIDKIDRTDFFQWHSDQLIAMTRDDLPELTAIHLRSQVVAPPTLLSMSYWGENLSTTLDVPGNESDRIRKLAEEWAIGKERGWQQINAVIDQLKKNCQHDPSWRPPADCLEPTSLFLFGSRRGPDYQFATSAALLLRSLGYSTRLVTGFYANPERFDRLQQHTAVQGRDLHTWVEVYMNSGVWLTIEPTPGYEVLKPPPTFFEHLATMVWQVWRYFVDHWPGFLAVSLAGVFLWWTRWQLIKWLVFLHWYFLPETMERRRIFQTLAVFEASLRVAGTKRPRHVSWGSFLTHWAHPSGRLVHPTMGHFAQLVEWAAYAPKAVPAPSQGQTTFEQVCRSVTLISREISSWRHTQGGAISKTDSRQPQLATVPGESPCSGECGHHH